MPGGFGTYGPWGSAGETYTTPSYTPSSGNGGGGYDTGGGGEVFSQGDPNDEKADYWVPPEETYVSPTGGVDYEQKMADMAKAQELAYNMQGSEGNMGQVSNLHNLTDSQLQFLIDSGFAASEASGVLGGVSGIELEMNKLKKDLASAKLNYQTTGNENYLNDYNKTLSIFDNLNKNIGGFKATDKQMEMGLMKHDPSAVYSWSDVESDPDLYKAHNDLLSSSLTPDQYRESMENISAFGHVSPTITDDEGGGGWTDYGGDGGGGGYYGDPRRGNPIEQMAGFYTPQANLQQAMVNVHNVPTGFQMKRGGIVSLLRLN